MAAESKSQQRFMGMVHAVQKGELSPKEVGPAVRKAAREMKYKDAKDYAETKHKGLPEKKASMRFFEKISSIENKSKEDIRKTFRNAERALGKNQKKDIMKGLTMGAILGGPTGALLAKERRGLGLLAGMGAGTWLGGVVGAVKGSRGSKAKEIRKKYFGTSDLDKIRKIQKENFIDLKDFYKKAENNYSQASWVPGVTLKDNRYFVSLNKKKKEPLYDFYNPIFRLK